MSSVTWSAASHESLIGPPSELVHIDSFLQHASDNEADLFSLSEPSEWAVEDMDTAQRDAVAAECSVDDVRSKLTDVFNDPHLYVHARSVHDISVNTIHDLAESSASNKRKRKREVVSEQQNTPELVSFKNNLSNIKLKSWPLPQEAAVFMRGPKNSDINTLAEIKLSSKGSRPPSESAIVVFSVYTRLVWSHNFVYRSSQHVVLSSQTLGDLYGIVPCPSNEFSDERIVDGAFGGYEPGPPRNLGGCVIVIEGTAYGDGLNEFDYASKLVTHMPKPLTKGSKINDAVISSLSLRLNCPYWLVHHGNCEHFLVVDQIRLLHPDDPSSDFPLTVQITPPLIGNCRACTKVPAVYSIVGDVRLGESPCIMCAPCWRNMGLPKGRDADNIMVIPLPKHEFGW